MKCDICSYKLVKPSNKLLSDSGILQTSSFDCQGGIGKRLRRESSDKVVLAINRSSTHHKVVDVSNSVAHVDSNRGSFTIVETDLKVRSRLRFIDLRLAFGSILVHRTTRGLRTASKRLTSTRERNISGRWRWNELGLALVFQGNTQLLVLVLFSQFLGNIALVKFAHEFLAFRRVVRPQVVVLLDHKAIGVEGDTNLILRLICFAILLTLLRVLLSLVYDPHNIVCIVNSHA